MIASLAVSNYFWLCITIINLSIHPFSNKIKDAELLLSAFTLAIPNVWSIMVLSHLYVLFIPKPLDLQ